MATARELMSDLPIVDINNCLLLKGHLVAYPIREGNNMSLSQGIIQEVCTEKHQVKVAGGTTPRARWVFAERTVRILA